MLPPQVLGLLEHTLLPGLCQTEKQTQCFVLAKQALHPMSHIPSLGPDSQMWLTGAISLSFPLGFCLSAPVLVRRPGRTERSILAACMLTRLGSLWVTFSGQPNPWFHLPLSQIRPSLWLVFSRNLVRLVEPGSSPGSQRFSNHQSSVCFLVLDSHLPMS